jgi:hypothetical protein
MVKGDPGDWFSGELRRAEATTAGEKELLQLGYP